MSAIREDFGQGGAGLTSTPGSQLHDPLAVVLRDIADDLGSLRTAINEGLSGLDIAAADPAAVAAGAIGAFTDGPTAGEMATLRTLVNELRTTTIANRLLALELKNDINAVTPATIAAADPTAVAGAALLAFTDPPAAAETALLRTLVNQIRVTAQETRTLAIELKTDVNAAAFGTVDALLTSKA